jgi:hypothetical protein
LTKPLLPGIEIVIAAHHRQTETIRAVDAISKVDFGMPTVIRVSDNPESIDKAIRFLPSNIIHTIRNPGGSAPWHMNQILSELQYEWTLVTHDDDEMLPALGDLFRKYSSDEKIQVITGISRIMDRNGYETTDRGYENRLMKAGLWEVGDVVRENLDRKLFEIGPLFPASAIIVRTNLLQKVHQMSTDFDLAGDFAYSISLASQSAVAFESSKPVMNYHIHGGNSVFSSQAAGGLMADFTIVRMDYLTKSTYPIKKDIKKMLTNGLIAARILSKSFGLKDRYRNTLSYAREVKKTRGVSPIRIYGYLPIPLLILKPVVRRLMWRRLGIKRWKK